MTDQISFIYVQRLLHVHWLTQYLLRKVVGHRSLHGYQAHIQVPRHSGVVHALHISPAHVQYILWGIGNDLICEEWQVVEVAIIDGWVGSVSYGVVE